MCFIPADLVLATAASVGAVLAAQIAAAHWWHEQVAEYKATLTHVVNTLLARGDLAQFVPLLPPGPRWWLLLALLGLLSTARSFTVVVVRHDGRTVRSVLLGWYRSDNATAALRALLPTFGLGDLSVSGSSDDAYLSFVVSGESDHWLVFVVPSGRRAFRAAMRDAGLAV